MFINLIGMSLASKTAVVDPLAYYPERAVKMVNVDAYRNGELSKTLRDNILEMEESKMEHISLVIVTDCNGIKYETFRNACYKAFFCIENGSNAICNSKADEVIKHIYDSGAQLNYSLEELVQFTATAMHNMYGFAKFESGSEDNNDLGSRGLLQTTGVDGYKKFTQWTGIKNISMLNKFDKNSIFAEMKTFHAEYYVNKYVLNSKCNALQLRQFAETTIRLAPAEADRLIHALNNCGKVDCKALLNCSSVEDQKLLRRFSYYILLHESIVKCRNEIVAVAVTETTC